MELGDRKKKILKAIVDEYIRTGEPVGSKALAAGPFSEFSAATIRNEMYNLEEMGYIDKPHVSAGRIPSTLGYREYVDRLMNSYSLSAEDQTKLTSLLDLRFDDKKKLVSEAVHRISDTLGYTAIAVVCQGKVHEIMKFEVVCVANDSLIIIAIDRNGVVKSANCKVKMLAIPFSPEAIKELLNSRLSGVTIADEKSVASLLYDVASIEEFAPVIETVKSFFSAESDNYDVCYDGVSNPLRIAGSDNMEKAGELLWMLEQKESFIRAVGLDSSDADVTRAIIGDEHPTLTKHLTSLVLSRHISIGGNDIVMGVLGPTRMNYAKVMASIDYVMRYFDKGFQSLDGKG